MKNIEQISLLSIAVLCAGLMVGILIGRTQTTRSVPLSAYDQVVQEGPVETVPYKSESIGKININFASADELTMLPQIGKTYAQRIIDYRTKHGPFMSIDDITNVSGIGNKRFEAIKDYITVGG